MIRITNILLFSLLPFLTVFSQTDGYYLKYEYQPNSSYTEITTIETEGELDLKASEEKLKTIISPETKLPIKTHMSQFMSLTTKTGPLNADSSISVKTGIDRMNAKNYLNDELKADIQDPLKNFTILGTYKNNGISNLSFEGEGITDEVREALNSVADNILQQIEYPENKVKIGESFQQELPLQIPVPGMPPLDLNMVMTYKLINVVDSLAYLDIETEMVVTGRDKTDTINADGGGKGELIHNLNRNFFVVMDLDMDIKYEITSGELKVVFSTKSKTTTKVTF